MTEVGHLSPKFNNNNINIKNEMYEFLLSFYFFKSYFVFAVVYT